MTSSTQISDLLVKYWKGKLSESEREFLFAWSEKKPHNKELLDSFDNASLTAQGVGELDNSQQEVWTELINRYPELKVRKLNLWPRLVTAAAAIIILCLGGFFIYQTKEETKHIVEKPSTDILPVNEGAVLTLSDGTTVHLDSTENTVARQGATIFEKNDSGLLIKTASGNEPVYMSVVQTFKGRKLTITLPDKTNVSLNVESKLQIPSKFTGDFREVTLLEGEAHFDVAHNKKQPFHVKVKGQEIAVTGTKFNVRAYPEQLEVTSTLFEGSVKIKAGKDKVEFDLLPGYELVADSVNDNFKISKKADLEKAGAWRENIFLFREASIEEIMRELSRHYDIDVKYATKNNQRFNAEIPDDLSIQTIFRILEATKGVRFQIEGRTITII